MIGWLQLPINTAEFLKDFLPGFAATIFGIPIGLWANTLVVAQTEKAERKQEATRLYHSLTTLNKALDFNIQQFGMMSQEHMNGKAFFIFTPDSSTWDIVKNDVIQYLDHPQLRGRIAYHFSRIEELRKTQSIYLDSMVGMMSALLESPLRTTLNDTLPAIIGQVSLEAQSLRQEIDLEQAKILRKYRLPKNLDKKQ